MPAPLNVAAFTTALDPTPPLGAMTLMDAAGPLAMGVGVLLLGLLVVGIALRFSRRR